MISWVVWDVKLESPDVIERKLPVHQDLGNGHRHRRYDPTNHNIRPSTGLVTIRSAVVDDETEPQNIQQGTAEAGSFQKATPIVFTSPL
jgi:hypothetical protein